MNSDSKAELVAVLENARQRAAASSHIGMYGNPDQTLTELDSHLNSIKGGVPPDLFRLKVLFAPTGDLQEVSIDNGWGDEFLRIAARFDEIAG